MNSITTTDYYAIASRPFGIDPPLLILIVAILLPIYMAPAILGAILKRSNRRKMALINLLLGWNGIAWIAVVIWAVFAKFDAPRDADKR